MSLRNGYRNAERRETAAGDSSSRTPSVVAYNRFGTAYRWWGAIRHSRLARPETMPLPDQGAQPFIRGRQLPGPDLPARRESAAAGDGALSRGRPRRAASCGCSGDVTPR